jgi:ribose-phosphate pyrophosphokinase
MMVFAPSLSAAFARSVLEQFGGTLASCEEREFDGGEHKIRPLAEVRNRDVFVIQSLCGEPLASANDKLCRLLFFIGALKDAGAERVTACIPYLAYARKDRRTQPRDPVTIRYVAAMFEAVGTDRVVALEVHNEAAFDNAFRCETLRLDAAQVFSDQLAVMLDSSPVCVASPDTGGIKRAQRLRETLADRLRRDVDFAFMEKRRALGVVSGETFVGDVAGSNVILYDDLISSGATIMRATKAARTAGAKHVYVATTHAVFQQAALQLFDKDGPDKVLVSDSIALAHALAATTKSRLRVCSVAPLFARAITELSAGVVP